VVTWKLPRNRPDQQHSRLLPQQPKPIHDALDNCHRSVPLSRRATR